MRTPVKVNDVPMSAVVDTAAEITIVVLSVYDKMPSRPEISPNKDVNLVGGGESMTVGALGDVYLEIGETNVQHHVNIAPLQVDILFEIDFLHENGVELNCSTGDLSDIASKVPTFKANLPSEF